MTYLDVVNPGRSQGHPLGHPELDIFENIPSLGAVDAIVCRAHGEVGSFALP